MAALDGRDNALNAVRLVLASLVIYGHGYLLAYGEPPAPVHGYAVDGFFAVSGFLIAGARQRSKAGAFLWRRTLRIVPGLVACLIVSAAVIAPFIAAHSSMPWSVTDAGSYVWRNGTFQIDVGESALPFKWNGSLWTIPYEFGCYVVLSVAFSLARRPRRALAVWFAACCAINAVTLFGTAIPVVSAAARLGAFFAAGALIYMLRGRVTLSPRLALVAAGLTVATQAVSYELYVLISPLALAYALLWVGAKAPTRIGSRNDISYGVYVYGFPVQQLLTLAGVGFVMPPVGFVLVSLLAVLPFAWASWLLVERPAMRLRSGVPDNRERKITTRARRRRRSAPHPHLGVDIAPVADIRRPV